MELEELKSIWKSTPSFQLKDEEEIASMLTGSSVSIIDKLKRNVWLEMILTVIVSVGMLVYALTLDSGAFKWTAISLLGTFMAYTCFYIKKIIILNRFNPANENIRANLITLINTLSGYLVIYKRSYTVLYPIFFCLMLLFIGIERGAESFFENLAKPLTLFLLASVGALYYFVSTKFANWYLNKLYGNHLEKLKSLLNDIHG